MARSVGRRTFEFVVFLGVRALSRVWDFIVAWSYDAASVPLAGESTPVLLVAMKFPKGRHDVMASLDGGDDNAPRKTGDWFEGILPSPAGSCPYLISTRSPSMPMPQITEAVLTLTPLLMLHLFGRRCGMH